MATVDVSLVRMTSGPPSTPESGQSSSPCRAELRDRKIRERRETGVAERS